MAANRTCNQLKYTFLSLGFILLTSTSSAFVLPTNHNCLLSPSSHTICHRPRLATGTNTFKDTRRGKRIDSTPDPHNQPNDDDGAESITQRFLSPRLDDPGLPLADALISQIVAPSLQVFSLGINHAPSPTWLKPLSSSLFYTRGSLVAPTLIHGAGLACCWIAGALAAKAYESDAFDVSNGKGYGVVLTRLVKAGAFATGLLLLSSQINLYLEFGGKFVQLGESEETDVRLLTAIIEVINDVFFEGVLLSSWRLYRASLTSDGNS